MTVNEKKFLDSAGTGHLWNRIEEQFINSNELGIAIETIDEVKADKEYVDTTINNPKQGIILTDIVNGYNYIVAMRDGKFVSRCTVKEIEITQMPDKIEYAEGELLDTTGMVVTGICYDGNTLEITDYTYANEPLVPGENLIEISYTEFGVTHTASITVNAEGFNPEVAFIDFEYTDNGDKTYTLTDWKGTKNGEASTEIMIPDSSAIVW